MVETGSAAPCGGGRRRISALACGEACDRFAFYGMQSLLFLYLEATLASPGEGTGIWGLGLIGAVLRALGDHGGPSQVASMLFGLFTGWIYLTTLLGGWAADRWLGQRNAAVLGGFLAALGYGLLALEPTFLVGLALLALGSGAFRGNLAAELGGVYGHGDPRRPVAYRLYFFIVMLGVLVAPVVCGGLAHRLGWRWGFAAGGLGMLCGVGIYLAFGQGRPTPGAREPVADAPSIGGWTLGKAAAVTLLLAILAADLIGVQQLYNAYMAWAEKSLVLNLAGRTLPPTVLLTLDSALMLVALCLVGGLWRVWRHFAIEPEPPAKIGLGSVCLALAYVCLAAIPARQGFMTYVWLTSFHMLGGLGFAAISPAALDFLTRSAPPGWRSRMASLFYLQFAVGSFLAGSLGRLLGLMPTPLFWLMHAAIFGTAAVAALVGARWIMVVLEPSWHASPHLSVPPSRRRARANEALATCRLTS